MESGKSSRLRLNQLRSGQTDQGGQELKVICVGFEQTVRTVDSKMLQVWLVADSTACIQLGLPQAVAAELRPGDVLLIRNWRCTQQNTGIVLMLQQEMNSVTRTGRFQVVVSDNNLSRPGAGLGKFAVTAR